MAKKQEGIYGSIRLNKEKYLNKFKELYDTGMTDSDIAKYLEICNVTVSNWRNSINLPKNFKYKRKFNKDKFIELYNKGLNYSEIARCLNVSSSACQDYGSKLGLSSNYNKYEDTKFSNEEFLVLLGTILGDASLRIPKNSKNASGHFAHSLKQKNYCIWKYSILKRFCSEPKDEQEYDKRTNKIYYSVRVRILSHPLITKVYNSFYKNGKKYINERVLNYIDPLGIAVWFMDDGCFDHGGFSIATNCFTENDIQIIINMFESKFGLHFSRQQSNNIIRLTAKEFQKFVDLISKYIHPDCIYKLHLNELPKTPLNRETPNDLDNPVLNPQEIGENAERLEVMPNKKDEAINSSTKAGHCLELNP